MLGDLRLYDGKPNSEGRFKKAKTQLATVREPITAVDCTGDGSWILGTTRSYLVAIPTKLSSTGKTGFEVPLGKQKPPPRYLKINVQDMMKHGLTDLNFSPAKFDVDETSIVTSTGNLAVIWDFASVKRGTPKYTIKVAENYIKDVKVNPDDAGSVVVAYPTALKVFGTELRPL
eukprot:Trichotokara_eunicae@DN4145_c0_g1_i2.p1